ncbi:type I secretion system permease/ATPase [Mesorhizobium sp. M1C.F.Ca.ET.193.01.1.1]|uniref:type I secretion system permease/ATPase n=1 Tax=unclassified Mesorhizobium TaxID=325217 RepID=UPI000FD46B91|nr:MULTISPECIES: type I secretion system permease/ATPase [unclassified Mesorhizobium]TGS93371.1 type I secretion system permease/ATPase [bacterium M00.F.Ca.ET.177.01.1.1]TGQ50648.1 type I secretion system permease/ATPase [Mesorhizobium sp. M1C.F.Ca.ET.210.01.1.1]TGQ65819.1 type I secretion system permease/ATPase [Mesorhizobium sp. M1C.F.Ca.ET.212.01.1.1]TGQ99764.1 type I secretion system permease/ATPase [Mesorhizobium sp. M1C.F.Ca.ET.204.01.1.1]TGR20180.1 type I secretion system permease/ATPas
MTGPSGLRPVFLRAIADVGAFSVLINILLLVIPLYLLQVYDRVLPSSSVETLFYLSLIAVLALAFLGFLDAVRAIYTQRVAATVDRKLGAGTFALSLAAKHAGGLSPLRDLASICAFIRSRGVAVLFDLPFAPVFLALLYLIHPVLFWVTLAGTVLLVLLVVANQLAIGRNDALSVERSALAAQAEQVFARNAETLRAMGMVDNAARVWGRHVGEALILHDRSASANAIFSGASRALRMMLQLAILGAGAWLVVEGQMTAGMIFASSLVSARALQPLDQLIGAWRQITDARRAWTRLERALAAQPAQARKLALPDPSGAIAVQDVFFMAPNAQPGTEPILKRLNFQIGAGEAVAIVGPSGAGKSTLARLLVGAAQPTGGSVRIDGADLRSWDENQLGRKIGYLAQEVELFPGSIAENVARFDQQADDSAIVEAARRAEAHELILSLRDGYQTGIGPSDRTLSGGERQRIGLARAFYGSPQILVLDEPSAHLDGSGEAALEAVLAAARAAGVTTIVITHRPSIAAACDRVMLLRGGMIEAFGPSSEVLRQPAAGKGVPAQQGTVVTGSFTPTIRAHGIRFGS